VVISDALSVNAAPMRKRLGAPALTLPEQAVGVVRAGLQKPAVDGGRWAGVVQADREVAAAVLAGFGPGDAEVGGAGGDLMVGGLVSRLVSKCRSSC